MDLITILILLASLLFGSLMRDIYVWCVASNVQEFTMRVRARIMGRMIYVHTKDYGHLGVRVYVTDDSMARAMKRLTGNKTITKKTAEALYLLGYRFELSSMEPMSLPEWLVVLLDDSMDDTHEGLGELELA